MAKGSGDVKARAPARKAPKRKAPTKPTIELAPGSGKPPPGWKPTIKRRKKLPGNVG